MSTISTKSTMSTISTKSSPQCRQFRQSRKTKNKMWHKHSSFVHASFIPYVETTSRVYGRRGCVFVCMNGIIARIPSRTYTNRWTHLAPAGRDSATPSLVCCSSLLLSSSSLLPTVAPHLPGVPVSVCSGCASTMFKVCSTPLLEDDVM